jgi:hypothetical protein
MRNELSMQTLLMELAFVAHWQREPRRKMNKPGCAAPDPPHELLDGRNHLCALLPSARDSSNTLFCFALGGAT